MHRSGFVFRWIIGLRSAGQPTFDPSSPGWCCSRHSSHFFARNPPTSPPEVSTDSPFERVVRFFEFSEEIRWGGEKFTSRVANRVKIGQREREREVEGKGRKEEKEREKSLSPIYHHRPSASSSTNETRTELPFQCRRSQKVSRGGKYIGRLI